MRILMSGKRQLNYLDFSKHIMSIRSVESILEPQSLGSEKGNRELWPHRGSLSRAELKFQENYLAMLARPRSGNLRSFNLWEEISAFRLFSRPAPSFNLGLSSKVTSYYSLHHPIYFIQITFIYLKLFLVLIYFPSFPIVYKLYESIVLLVCFNLQWCAQLLKQCIELLNLLNN